MQGEIRNGVHIFQMKAFQDERCFLQNETDFLEKKRIRVRGGCCVMLCVEDVVWASRLQSHLLSEAWLNSEGSSSVLA